MEGIVLTAIIKSKYIAVYFISSTERKFNKLDYNLASLYVYIKPY